ncbi:LacI family DNA-binding transcriptional regulator [Micromonospora chersina]|uniref:LacI family DNA-binding transcriptional regulator n=1 Tax=Micromonospora chersina TaxID=47854 RepID=UPI0037228F5D
MRAAGRVSISDVAADAGVSISTVSAALNDVGSARISPRTRDRIREVAGRLGYVPNGLAQGLRRQRSGMVGFIGDEVATTPYAVGMILGAQETLRAAGILMVLMNSQGDPALEAREIEALRQQRVEGILYASMYHRRLEPPAALRDMATVLLDAESRVPEVSWVVPDEVAGARAAVGELLAHGHRRIGFLNNHEDIPAARLRLRGFRAAMKQARVAVDPTLVGGAPPTTSGGYDAARRMLQRADRPTALFCFSDLMAMGAYHAARELGLDVPADVSIVGYDNMPHVADGLLPGLTTVELPHYEMGAWAAGQLLALISAEPGQARHVRLRGQLVRRGSVAVPGPIGG